MIGLLLPPPHSRRALARTERRARVAAASSPRSGVRVCPCAHVSCGASCHCGNDVHPGRRPTIGTSLVRQGRASRSSALPYACGRAVPVSPFTCKTCVWPVARCDIDGPRDHCVILVVVHAHVHEHVTCAFLLFIFMTEHMPMPMYICMSMSMTMSMSMSMSTCPCPCPCPCRCL